MMKAICKEIYRFYSITPDQIKSLYYDNEFCFYYLGTFDRINCLLNIKMNKKFNDYMIFVTSLEYKQLPKYYTRAIYENENFLNQCSENADLYLLMSELARKDLIGFLKLITNKSARKNKEFRYLFGYYIIQGILLSCLIPLAFLLPFLIYEAVIS